MLLVLSEQTQSRLAVKFARTGALVQWFSPWTAPGPFHILKADLIRPVPCLKVSASS